MKVISCGALLLVAFSGYIPLSFSDIGSTALWVKGKKKIAVCVDIHRETALSLYHKQFLVALFSQLAQTPKRAEVVLEHLKCVNEQDMLPQEQMLCIDLASHYAYYTKLRQGSLAFILSDLRCSFPGIASLVNIFWLLLEEPQLIQFKAQSGIGEPVSIDVVKNDLALAMSIIKNLADKTTTQEAAIFLRELADKSEDYYFKLFVFLEAFQGKERTVWSAFRNSLAAHGYAKNKIDELRNLYLGQELREDIADIGFIKDSIESQSRVDTTLVYIGALHATILNRILLALDYKLLEYAGPALIDIQEEATLEPLSDRDLEHFRQALLH